MIVWVSNRGHWGRAVRDIRHRGLKWYDGQHVNLSQEHKGNRCNAFCLHVIHDSLYCTNEGSSILWSLPKLTVNTLFMFIGVCVMSLSVSKSLATWETENKIYCKQTLVDGDGPKTYWSRELKGDELILVRIDRQTDGYSCWWAKLVYNPVTHSTQPLTQAHKFSPNILYTNSESYRLQLCENMKSDRISLAHFCSPTNPSYA